MKIIYLITVRLFIIVMSNYSKNRKLITLTEGQYHCYLKVQLYLIDDRNARRNRNRKLVARVDSILTFTITMFVWRYDDQ